MNNVAHDELEELLPIVESFEFPYCDMAHEDLIRDAEGNPASSESEIVQIVPECPLSIQSKRLCCTHCSVGRIPFLELLVKLEAMALFDENMKQSTRQCMIDIMRLEPLDVQIRRARMGETIWGLHDRVTAEKNAAPLVAEHRAIVDRMRHFRDTLVTMAKELL